MLTFIKGLFTDSMGRPEAKMVLGIPLVIATTVYAMLSKDIVVSGFLMGTALALIGVTAVTDAKNDKGARDGGSNA